MIMTSKDNRPNVSIITICYNPGTEIIKTIESVLAQDYDNYEYLIKDGGSTDGTLEVIQGYKAKFRDKNIELRIISDKDDGIYNAMNTAVSNAVGTWVNFMNSGDCFYSATVLSDIFNKSNYPDAAILYGDAVECEYNHYYMFRKAFDQIESRMPFSHQSAFVNRELMSRFPFRTDYRIGADYDFLLSMYRKGFFFRDTGVITCIISKDGVSSVRLYDTYLETIEIRKRHDIPVPTDKEFKRMVRIMKVKQFVMDYFPAWIKKCIRRFQLAVRKQNANLIIPPWENQ